MQAGHLFVQLLGKHGYGRLGGFAVLPEGNLSQHLVGEAVAHHEGSVTRGAAQVHQAAFGQQIEAVAIREGVLIHLRLDVGAHNAGVGLQAGHLNLVIEVADVADDSLVLNFLHVLQGNDIAVTRGGHVNVGHAEGVLHRQHAVAFHGSLQSADGVHLGHNHLGTKPAQSLGAALAHIAIAADNGHLTGNHHIRGALDTVRQAFAAAVQVIKLALGHRVIHIDGGHQQTPLALHLVEAVHTGGRFLGNTLPLRHPAVEHTGLLGSNALQQSLDNALFLAVGGGIHPVGTLFHLITAVQQQRHVAAVVHHQLRAQAIAVAQGSPGAIPVFRKRLALPGEHRHTSGRNGSGSVILRRENVAAGPAHLGTQGNQRLDEHSRLNRHVQRTGDTNPGQRLLLAVFLTAGHQARHLVFRHGNFLASPILQGNIGHLIISCRSHDGGEFTANPPQSQC